MHLTAMTTPDGKAQYSFLYGPIVLAAKTGTDRQDGMYADDSRGGHIAVGPQIPLYQMPAIIGDKESVLSHLQPVADRPMTFRLNGLTLPSFEGMELVPFYQLYECRYQIYFPLYTANEWNVKKEEIAAAEQERQALESLTLDKIFCGEQQSESDHFFLSEASWNGADEGIHWRRARGSFSYQMKGEGAAKLRIKGFIGDREPLTVTINGVSLGNHAFDRQGLMVVELPAEVRQKEISLTLAAVNGRQTPRVSEIRLCK